MEQVIFFTGCIPEILLGQFLDTSSHTNLKNIATFATRYFKMCMTILWTLDAIALTSKTLNM